MLDRVLFQGGAIISSLDESHCGYRLKLYIFSEDCSQLFDAALDAQSKKTLMVHQSGQP